MRAASPGDITVQICVLTYKRPDLLRSTLESLMQQATCLSQSRRTLQLHLLVVDNDSAQSGHHVVDEFSLNSPHPLRYISEPARGLSTARNRALDESTWADFVAFIDDDETANPDWLVTLVAGALCFEADVVTGPVHPRYSDAPHWIKQGGFFSPVQRKTGSEVPFVATNNVLLSSSIVQIFRFDSRFDQTGGEDTEYFMRVAHNGHRIVWVQEAVVTEAIPQERTNLRWLLSRARSDANRYTRSCLSFDRGPRTIALRLFTASGGFLKGALLLPCVVFGRHCAARGLQLISRSIGTLAALRGQAHVYYRPAND
ncbi:glycosyltransferase family 2 protein [Granulicella arctica]|uniref:glycosyltransferase family 2 protein n=1 Tax=Granulicella arctica TaxID=940613 RepID=UPI0037C08526